MNIKFRFLDENDALREDLNKEFAEFEKLVDNANGSEKNKLILKLGYFNYLMDRESCTEVFEIVEYNSADSKFSFFENA